MEKKSVLVLGSTGSVGKQALELLSRMQDRYQVKAIVFNSNVDEGRRQAIVHRVPYVVVADESLMANAQALFADSHGTKVLAGRDAVMEVSSWEYDLTVVAISGIDALEPMFMALNKSKVIALANKESIVCAGHLLQQYLGKIIPIDSEHNGVFQLLHLCPDSTAIDKITITASGGPFWFKTAEEIAQAGINEALAHPKWSMGAKISVDSATMMNKGLELIEAAYLFNKDIDDIDFVVHPESIVHAMVRYKDGVTMMHAALPDMKIPLLYALNYPQRQVYHNRLDFQELLSLRFYPPDHQRFVLPNLAVKAWHLGPHGLIALNAANEQAVMAFLKGEISYSAIPEIVRDALNCDYSNSEVNDIKGIIALDKLVRKKIDIDSYRS